MTIVRLSPLLINQIAAGEVIERPASCVKELVENALDAGAARIDVTIEQGGRRVIEIRDDGSGINADEMTLALTAHATSKLSSIEDLDAIGTLGFRGEALASIASISHLTIQSRSVGAKEASKITAEAGQIQEVMPAAGPQGTLVTVRNLFFNTPARGAFLKTDQTEARRCAQAIRDAAATRPDVAFSLSVDGRQVLNLTGGVTPADRACEILGRETRDELLEVDERLGDVRVWGLIGRPGLARATTQHQHLYLNGRPIVDRAVTHAVREAYRGLIEPNRHPLLLLELQVNPAQVDVNVHPTKSQVRFRDSGAVHRAVRKALSHRLTEADLTPRLDLDRAAVRAGRFANKPSESGTHRPSVTRSGGMVESFDSDQVASQLDPANILAPISDEQGKQLAGASEVLPSGTRSVEVLQLHRTYLVVEDEGGMVVIDQHALHERVMFQQLMDRLNEGPLQSQRLLVPAVIEIKGDATERVTAMSDLFDRIGIEADVMGPETVAVHAFPTLLFERRVDPVEFMSELLDRSLQDDATQSSEAALHEVVDMMACKAAIKAGDVLTEQEMKSLVGSLEETDRSTRCPHGRPTLLRLSLEELEKQFGRSSAAHQ